jgi:hypothetical protein
MDAKVAEALEASIEKWRANVAAEAPEDATLGGWSECPLCRLFWVDFASECDGCPVSTRTGEDMCRDTPYVKADALHTQWLFADDEFADDKKKPVISIAISGARRRSGKSTF